jgi:MFS family permease
LAGSQRSNPATWGLVQLLTGALSDRIGRKWLIVGGMWTQAVGITAITLARAFAGFAIGSVLCAFRTNVNGDSD